jgi:hypothetical protein
MPQKSPEEWAKIRYAYEAGTGPAELARQYGVSRQRITKKAREECWTQDVEPAIRRMVAESVAGVVVGATPAEKAAAMHAEADRRQAVIERHRKEWSELEDLRQRVIDRVTEAEKVHDWEEYKRTKIFADTITDMLNALRIKQDGERKAWNLDDPALRIDVTKASDAELEAMVRGRL